MLLKRTDPTSPNYPLPADYGDLTEDGRRQARISGCRQHLLRYETPEDVERAYVAATQLFDAWYLHPDEDDDFFPMFYTEDPLPTPEMHLALRRQAARFWLALAVMPRGSGKTMELRKEILHHMITEPGWFAIYATSTNSNMEDTGYVIKNQLQDNQRINDDWRPEFPDMRIVPSRGEAPFSISHMRLKNRAGFRGTSARSRIRGGRPRVFYLDDPEYDPTGETSMAEIRRYMETLVFRIALNTIMRAGGRMVWRGTFVTRRHFLWHAVSGRVVPDGYSADDPRFDLWHRLIYRMYTDGPEGPVSCWPEMWPITEKAKAELEASDPPFEVGPSIEQIRQAVGGPIFDAEYMARPGEGEDQYFGVLTEDTHGYWYEDVDDLLDEQPHRSTTKICWKDTEETVHKVPLIEFVRTCRLFMTGDTSATARPDSDFKVCCCLAIAPGNVLFVLDIWGAQCREPLLVKQTLLMAAGWRAPNVFPEAIREGRSYYESLHAIIAQRAKEMAGVDFLPSVQPFNPGSVTKTAKIAAGLFRFEHGLIKLPLRRRMSRHWRALFEQIEEFNPDVEDGGLQHDDHIDCAVGMPQFIVKGRLRAAPKTEPGPQTPVEHLKAGDLANKDGVPYAYGVDWLTGVSTKDMEAIFDALADTDGPGKQPSQA